MRSIEFSILPLLCVFKKIRYGGKYWTKWGRLRGCFPFFPVPSMTTSRTLLHLVGQTDRHSVQSQTYYLVDTLFLFVLYFSLYVFYFSFQAKKLPPFWKYPNSIYLIFLIWFQGAIDRAGTQFFGLFDPLFPKHTVYSNTVIKFITMAWPPLPLAAYVLCTQSLIANGG